MRLLIVIINYRTAALVTECLRSLSGEITSLPDVRVVVTDNASGDASIEQIARTITQEHWADWASTQPLPRNGGFAYGNNRAIEPALHSETPPQYVLLLNPDTTIHPGAIGELLSFMDGHPNVGIAGSRLEDPDGTPQRSAFRFPTIFSEIDNGLRLGPVSRLLDRYVVAPPPRNEAHRCDWVSGASMMIRREVFTDVGLFDEGFFLYFEETDFCRRATRRGWECWHVPASRVTHLVGQSSGLTGKPTGRRQPTYWFDSRHRYLLRNHGAFYAFLANVAFATCFALWRIRRAIQRKPDTDPPKLLGDFVRHSLFGSPTQAPAPALPLQRQGAPPSTVGVVVIGRNEGERLLRCLQSVLSSTIDPSRVIYVDSGSTDASPDAARSRGITAVDLDTTTPFTAARARNAGLDRLCCDHPDAAFVQFVDGDCELAADWLSTASAALEQRDDLAVVFGRLRERRRDANAYHRLCDIEWDATPIGDDATGSGGNAMMRVSALQQVGPFNPMIIAAEDSELCARLRLANYKIARLDAEMGTHDAAMNRFSQWWRRMTRAGHGFAENAALHGRTPLRHWLKETRSNWAWGTILPLAAEILCWPTRGLSFAAAGLAYVMLFLKIRHSARRRGLSPTDASLYARFSTLAKFPLAIGQTRYWINRWRGRQQPIIEYKQPSDGMGMYPCSCAAPEKQQGHEYIPMPPRADTSTGSSS